ncbi:hypothetical protein [Nonomuraea gerenzanensis]|uniref:Uncharacterized protein n=1 Tax=Nonomuraea gerenzanensis TaxID=93944 RepID=A0A1M4EC86_9ACTN|nr:hypothetical protein [Nonomuraea gerenzanensis]UBU18567.1 hypothetical protein LCN96_27160 [Nonomuraea gerenzanensis]SBO96410.1 hypothetical protein BN4615_P5926 [Nonomuraea gerenzanensis]
MPEPGQARSLVEAHVYLDLAVSGGSAQASVTETPDGWLVRAGGLEVPVPYEAEQAARRTGTTFGTGVSELLDPGQWTLIGATYASRALEGALFFTADPSPDPGRFQAVVADWSYAADALAEALKFLPDGAEALPPETFWTELGRSARDAEPERFTRAKLESDLAFYRQSLADFQRLHAGDTAS